ncbi:MAG: beta-propeller fold lactonase family protein, partial [Cellulosilyticaceae bacterium]
HLLFVYTKSFLDPCPLDGISTLKILANGTLTLVRHTTCEGIWPRHIDCSQEGKALMICNLYYSKLCKRDSLILYKKGVI